MVVRGEEMVAMEGVKGEAVHKLDMIVVVVMKLLATANQCQQSLKTAAVVQC